MQAYGISNNHDRFRTIFVAVIIGAVLVLGPETVSHVNHAVTSAITPPSDEAANAHRGDSWSQLPVESRELWKFRLTTRR